MLKCSDARLALGKGAFTVNLLHWQHTQLDVSENDVILEVETRSIAICKGMYVIF